MDRTNASGHVDIGGGRRGYRDRDLIGGVDGTALLAVDRNAIQEEILAIIEAAGLTPSSGNLAQLLAATTALFGAGRLIGVQVFTASGTYTPTPGTKSVIAEVLGGGGAGGGAVANGAGANSLGGSGAAGGYSRSRITSGFAGAAITIGPSGVAVSGGNGGNGGTSSLASLVSSPGGGGGVASGSGTAPVGAAGVAGSTPSGGNIVNLRGQAGTTTFGVYSQGLTLMSPGANSPYGAGGAPQLIGNAGAAGTGFGAGGAGAVQGASAGALSGGNGSPGLVLIWEYS